jgi:hypothetical protein
VWVSKRVDNLNVIGVIVFGTLVEEEDYEKNEYKPRDKRFMVALRN